MPEIKEKPRAVKTKDRRKSAGPPRQAGRLMKEKLVREADQRKEREAGGRSDTPAARDSPQGAEPRQTAGGPHPGAPPYCGKRARTGQGPPGTGAPGCLATRNTYCKGGAGASPRAQVRRISRRGPPQRGGTGRPGCLEARGGCSPPCHGRDKTQDRSPRRKETRRALAGRQGASGAQGPGS